MRQWLAWFAAVWFGATVIAAAVAGPNAASQFGLAWARGYDKWAYQHHVPARIIQIGCKPDGPLAVACKMVLRDDTTRAKVCVGVVLGTASRPGPSSPLLGRVNLPPKSCGLGSSGPLSA